MKHYMAMHELVSSGAFEAVKNSLWFAMAEVNEANRHLTDARKIKSSEIIKAYSTDEESGEEAYGPPEFTATASAVLTAD